MDGGWQQTRPARVFVGRLPQLDALASALAAARAGEPQVVLIRGEAGIGKSSLIFEFLERQRGLPAVIASGEADESALCFGLVQQLAAGAAVAAPGALARAELLSRGLHPDTDPLMVGVELRALISSLQTKQAAVVVAEDLQWVDLPSARALLFACRRLGSDQVLVILSCRAEGMPQLGEGWARFISGDRRASAMSLGGLDDGELGALCQQLGRSRLPGRTVRQLADYTRGNPLLARTLLVELTDEALNATGGLIRAPKSLAGLVLPRLAALPRQAHELVVAASVLGDQCPLADAAAVAGTTQPAAALQKAEQAGLLLQRGAAPDREVSFPHPLIRQAIYDDLGAERRNRLHLRAAATLGGQEALTHRAAAAVGPDPELADDLSAAATAAVTAGNLLVAARYLHQAAALTGRGPDRDERMLSAFELLVRVADVAAADAIRPVIEQMSASARRDTALGQLALLAGRPADAEALLRAACDVRDLEDEGTIGGEAALGLGTLLMTSGSYTEATAQLDRALGSGTGSEPWYDAARCMRSFAFALGGALGPALGLFSDLPERSAMVPAARTDALAFRGVVRLWTGDSQAAADDLARAVNRISAGLQVRFPGLPLAFLAETEFRLGRWDDARSHAELAVALACDADRDYDLAFAHSAAVSVAACRGDWAGAADHVKAVEQAARTFGGLDAILAASAHAILSFARDDPEEALRGAALALAVPEVERYVGPAAFWWRPAQIWALIRTGDLSQAEATLTVFESGCNERSALTQAAWLRGSLAMARGDLNQADKLLQAARHASRGLPAPFQRALLDLQHGRCLFRLQRHRAAINAVRAAHEVFGVLGAHPFTRAAESVLSARGVRRPRASEPELPGLTAQELRVARLVASGLSNREAAAQLYLSPKTVEYHLAHAFTKLGVRSRHQLIARVHGGESPGIPA